MLYNYDTNSIHAAPIKSRHADDIIEGYETCYDEIIRAGAQPVLQRLDNKISRELIAAIEGKKLDYQVATPGGH